MTLSYLYGKEVYCLVKHTKQLTHPIVIVSDLFFYLLTFPKKQSGQVLNSLAISEAMLAFFSSMLNKISLSVQGKLFRKFYLEEKNTRATSY
jgi:Ni,Fe-hydrogenase I cytochrome b subunit